MFFHPSGGKNEPFRFSSDLEKIGSEWDVVIQNGTGVDVLSDPVEIERKPYGKLSVIKIIADVATDYHTILREFWVPTFCVVKLADDEKQVSVVH